jgi:predicted secreted protein
MSKYKRIATKITDEGLLVKALEALGIPYERGDDLNLCGYQGDRRRQTAQVVVRRQHIDPYANDLGFARTDNGYEAIISEYDQSGRGARMLGEIKQRYAFEGVKQ